MPRFCRHNRLTAECPICSRGTVLDPARSAERRPRASSGARARQSRSRREPSPAPARGPYASAPSAEAGREVRLERVAGGLRLGEWQAGQIARSAPRLSRLDLAALLGDAARKGLLGSAPPATGAAVSAGAHGGSPGRAGELRDELRVELLDRDRVRIARWILRPNAGWLLQEAPVMLPAARFEEALAAAAELGVLAAGSSVPIPDQRKRR